MKWVYYAVQIGFTTWLVWGMSNNPNSSLKPYEPGMIVGAFMMSVIPTAMLYWTVEFFRWLRGKWTGTPYKPVSINGGVPVGLAAYYGPEAKKRLKAPTSKIGYQSSEKLDPPKIRDERL